MDTEASLSLNTDGVIIRFESGLEKILGYSSKEARGRAFADLLKEDEREGFPALLDRVGKEGLTTEHKTFLVCKDGGLVDMFLSMYPLRDLSGKISSFMVLLNFGPNAQRPAILTDVFRRMFMFSNDAVAITDPSGNIIDVNSAFLDTYGYAKEEVLGRNPRILKSQHSTKDLYERMWKDILDPEKNFWRGEIINLRKDGKEVPVLLSINAIKDRKGEIKNFLGIAFNMSRHKEMERTQRMYVDSIVHDIRGPLTTVIANAEMLMIQFSDADEKVKRKLKSVLDSSIRLSGMAEDMLDYSRVRSGGLRLYKEACGFANIVMTAAAPFERSEKKLFINGTELGAAIIDDRKIFVDGDKLQRVIYNLLSNGMKHASSEVRVTFDFIDDTLHLSVYNDGKAISAWDAEKIFDPFYQAEDGIRTGGAGLGLSIVKGFVEAHGGKVWIEPGEGRGAAFCFTMPCAVPATPVDDVLKD